jgi:hypothetical protein
MTWKLDGVRIYVEEDSGWKSTARKGEINLLNTNYTIVHTLGRESYRRELQFVVFSGYYESILPIEAKSSVVFEDDDGVTTNVTVINMEPERLYSFHDRKIHRVRVELMQDDS